MIKKTFIIVVLLFSMLVVIPSIVSAQVAISSVTAKPISPNTDETLQGYCKSVSDQGNVYYDYKWYLNGVNVINGTYPLQVKKYFPELNSSTEGLWDLGSGDGSDDSEYIYLAALYRNDSSPLQDKNVLLKKFDLEGNEIIAGWNKTIDYDHHEDMSGNIVLDDDGYVYTVVYSKNITSGDFVSRIIKFSPNGSEVTNNYPILLNQTLTEDLQRIIYDSGFIYVIGFWKNTSTNNYQPLFKKYYLNGSIVNSFQPITFPPNESVQCTDIAVNSIHEISIACQNIGTQRALVKQYDSYGNELTRGDLPITLPNLTLIRDIKYDSNNNLYAATRLWNQTPAYSPYYPPGTVKNYDEYIYKIDYSGLLVDNNLWPKHYDFMNAFDLMADLYIDSQDNLYSIARSRNYVNNNSDTDGMIRSYDRYGIERPEWFKVYDYSQDPIKKDNPRNIYYSAKSNKVYFGEQARYIISNTSGKDILLGSFSTGTLPGVLTHLSTVKKDELVNGDQWVFSCRAKTRDDSLPANITPWVNSSEVTIWSASAGGYGPAYNTKHLLNVINSSVNDLSLENNNDDSSSRYKSLIIISILGYLLFNNRYRPTKKSLRKRRTNRRR